MNTHYVDTIVVGGGVMGCAAAYHLAKEGAGVLLLEQYGIGTRKGSSHGASRLFRLAHTSRDYVELARTAQGLWRELEAESGERLLHRMDGIDLGSAEMLEGFRTALMDARVPFEQLERDEIMRRFLQFSLPEGTLGLLQDSYAILSADRTVSTLAAQARKLGGTVIEGETVVKVRPAGEEVEVQTDKATYRAGRAVLCAGSWMRPMMKGLGIDLPLTVIKEHLTYFQPDDPSIWLPGRFPIFRHHLSGENGRWGVGFPIFERGGVKLLVDCTGPVVEPEDPDRTPDQAVLKRVKDYAASVLPSLGGNMIEAETCRYTMTPDDDFIIDRHPEYGQIVIASPCSGHGFKFAPLIGRILADLAMHGRTDYEIERFRLDRQGLKDYHEGHKEYIKE